jgi:hypothetical protein
VDVDDTGMAKRRKGLTELDDAPWHSVFCDGWDCVGVRDGALCAILDVEPFQYVVLREGLSEERVGFAQVNKDIYYTCGDMKGRISNNEHRAWAWTEYVGPKTDRVFSPPPPAKHIAFHNARIWLAIDNYLVASEPLGWSWFDLHGQGRLLDSDIRMLKPVKGGMYISTETKTYFMTQGGTQEELLVTAAEYPALSWSAANELVDGFEIGIEEPGPFAVWVSPRGACVGSPSGIVINQTRNQVVFPETDPVGASVLRGYNLIFTMGV